MRASQLAELQPASGTPEESAKRIYGAVASSYVHTFRVVVSVCALLAFMSSVIAVSSLPRNIEGRGEQSSP